MIGFTEASLEVFNEETVRHFEGNSRFASLRPPPEVARRPVESVFKVQEDELG
jgi:hypothetical protein